MINRCVECGSHHVVKAGTYRTRKGLYQRHMCKACGRVMKGGRLA